MLGELEFVHKKQKVSDSRKISANLCIIKQSNKNVAQQWQYRFSTTNPIPTDQGRIAAEQEGS